MDVMEIGSFIISVINSVFAIFGVFVGVETLRLRARDRKNKEMVVTEDSKDFKESFSEKFLETEIGSHVEKFEYYYQKTKSKFDESVLIKTYRDNAFIKFKKAFINHDILGESKGQLYIATLPLIILFSLLFLISFFIESNEGMFVVLLFIIAFWFLPFGVYSDTKENYSRVIYSIFTLGEVKKVKAVIHEQASGFFELTLIFSFTFAGVKVAIPKRVTMDSVEKCVKEYLLVRRLCGFGNAGRFYTVISADKFDQSSHVFFTDIKYGWLKLVSLLWQKRF